MFLEQTQRNFDGLAEEAASNFFSKGTNLSDSIVTIAKREKLNPMEIQRLVEKSNTAATLKLLRISTDKKAEFEVAVYEDVIKKIYPEKKTESPVSKGNSEYEKSSPNSKKEVEKVASEKLSTTKSYSEIYGTSLPNTRKKLDKTANANIPTVPLTKIAEKKEPSMATKIFKLSKDIEETVQRKVACELKIQDNAERIISDFSMYNAPSFSKFANEVYTSLGNAAIPLLKGIADSLKEDTNFQKIASGYVDDTSKAFKMFKEAQESLVELVSLQKDITHKKQELSDYYSKVDPYAYN
jgi:hypothetical protein